VRQVVCPVLVGRDVQLQAVAAGVDAASRGRGAAVFVIGEAGVGKSRLAREAATAAAARGVVVLVGRAVQGRTPDPYRPITEALMSVLRSSGLPQTAGLAPFRSVLGRVVPEWRSQGIVESGESSAVLGEGVLRLLTALSRGSGVLLVLEDLQWADPETMQVLEYVADNLGEQPVCCLATLRSEQWGGGLVTARALIRRGSAVMIDLTRLSPSEMAEMARRCLEVVDLPAGLEGLMGRAEGSPFMVEELLAAAISADTLLQEENGWSYRQGRTQLVPRTLVETVGQRLTALRPRDRDVVLAASLLGRQFDWTLLGATLQCSDDEVLESLRRAADAQLVVLDADDFRFRHSLTCDAVAAQLVGPERVRLASAALRAIQGARPGLPGQWCELAATLSETAGAPVAAAEFLRQAHAYGNRRDGRLPRNCALTALRRGRRRDGLAARRKARRCGPGGRRGHSRRVAVGAGERPCCNGRARRAPPGRSDPIGGHSARGWPQSRRRVDRLRGA
jgi:hypothetical protein